MIKKCTLPFIYSVNSWKINRIFFMFPNSPSKDKLYQSGLHWNPLILPCPFRTDDYMRLIKGLSVYCLCSFIILGTVVDSIKLNWTNSAACGTIFLPKWQTPQSNPMDPLESPWDWLGTIAVCHETKPAHSTYNENDNTDMSPSVLSYSQCRPLIRGIIYTVSDWTLNQCSL